MASTAQGMRLRLEAYIDTRKELKLQTLRLEQMRESMGDVRSPSYDPGKAKSTPGDAVSRSVIALEKLEERVAQLACAEESEHEALENIICRITNAHQRALLRMRYFDLLEWSDIADSFYGDRIDYLTCEHEYKAKLYRLHTRAVASMATVYAKLAA